MIRRIFYFVGATTLSVWLCFSTTTAHAQTLPPTPPGRNADAAKAKKHTQAKKKKPANKNTSATIPIPKGPYTLRNAAHPNRCLTADKDSRTVRLMPCLPSSKRQRWYMHIDGTITTPSQKGRCLEASYEKSKLRLRLCRRSPNQRWKHRKNGTLISQANRHKGTCLEIDARHQALRDGQFLRMRKCQTRGIVPKQQRWQCKALPKTHKVTKKPLPKGPYRANCKEIRRHNNSLAARCQTVKGRWVPTRIDRIHLCTSPIANSNGRLVCERD